MNNYYDDEEYGYPNRKKKGLTFGKLIKYIFIALMVCFVLLLAGRLYTASYYPPDMKKLYFNDTLTEYYKKTDSFEAYTQDLSFHYDDPDFADNYFFANHMIYIPEAKQLQVVMRYNDSALEKLATKFSLSEIPAPSPDLFTFTLSTLYTDENDEEVTRRYECSYLYTDEKYMYNYIKLIFDGVEFDDGANWLRVDTYFSSHQTVGVDDPLSKNLVWQDPELLHSSRYDLSKSEAPVK